MAGAVRPPTMKIDSTPPAASPLLPNLRLANLSSNREQTYYILVVLLSVIAWVVLAFTIIGAAYALLAGFFLWLGHGLLAAHLRAEAVHVNERQMPELHATFLAVCQQLEITDPPRLCVLQSGGVLNAFAMRHAGRDFVVVYSEFLEAFGPDSPEIRFILGHELGHLKSRHVLKQILLAPGLIFPLIGPAYRRAWETSCDRHGAFVAGDMNGALRAMLTLSGGKSPGRALNAEAFASQYEEERGFFVSLHELTSSYPTLSRRVRDLRALQDGTEASRAPRHPLAYFAALFVPGGNVGGGGASSALVMVVVIGLLAAMAIPAFQKVRQASEAKACYNSRLMLSTALEQYTVEHGQSPRSFADIVGPGKILPTMPVCPTHGTYSARHTGTGFEVSCSNHGQGAPQIGK